MADVRNLEEDNRVFAYLPYAWYDKGKRPLPPELSPALCEAIWPEGVRGQRTIKRFTKTKVQFQFRVQAPQGHIFGVKHRVYYMKCGVSGATLVPFTDSFQYTTVRAGDYTATHFGSIDTNEHVCLLVSIDYADSPGAGPAEPAKNWKWAQLNLIDPRLTADGKFSTQFIVANPLDVAESYSLHAGVVRGEKRQVLAYSLGVALLEEPDVEYSITDLVTGRSEQTHDELDFYEIALAPNEERTFEITGQLRDKDLGSAAAIEIVQRREADEPNRDIGGLTVLAEVTGEYEDP